MVTTPAKPSQPPISRLIDGILGIKPLYNLAKNQARQMMIKRSEKLGIPWRETVEQLRSHDWAKEKEEIENPNLVYPEYYARSFHGYDKGHLSWEAAWEFEVAANTVHSTLWGNMTPEGDKRLRQSYHQVLKKEIPTPPQNIIDLHCTVGMSTFPLQEVYPQAQITGLDFSPHYLAVANYNGKIRNSNIPWIHALPEATGLDEASFDLASVFLLFHEMPSVAIKRVFTEGYRILRSGGHFAFMDMNPRSPVYQNMPSHIRTLFKSTEPFIEQYFALDVEKAMMEAGFEQPSITCNSPRHRTVIARKP